MHIELGNSLEEMPAVMAALEEFSETAGLNMAIAQAAELVLDELLNNVISYGCPDSNQHQIVVDMSIEENALRIVVSDDGIPFNPLELKAPDLDAPIEERELGGVGIYLVQKFMDEFTYQRLEGRNEVTLLKYLPKG